MQKRHDVRRKELRFIQSDDIVSVQDAAQCFKIIFLDSQSVIVQSGTRLDVRAPRIHRRTQADGRHALFRVYLKMAHELERLAAGHGAGEEGEGTGHIGR